MISDVSISIQFIAIVFILIIIISYLSSLTVPGPPRSIKAVVSGPSSVVVSWLPPERPAGQVIQVQHTTLCFHHLCFFYDHVLGDIKTSIPAPQKLFCYALRISLSVLIRDLLNYTG